MSNCVLVQGGWLAESMNAASGGRLPAAERPGSAKEAGRVAGSKPSTMETHAMRMTLKHIGIRSTEALDTWVEKRMMSLRNALRIDEAVVRLRREQGLSPAYRVDAHLVTPGLDVMAEASDHTLPAAFEKLIFQLRSKIDSRDRKRLQRVKSNLSAPAAKSRGSTRHW